MKYGAVSPASGSGSRANGGAVASAERWCLARVCELRLARDEVRVEFETALGRKEYAWMALYEVTPNVKRA